MRALFSMGEEVLLQSKSCPELNGECIILEVRESKSTYGMHLGKIVDLGTPYGYKTTIPCPTEYWSEVALRKKHKPSEDSYQKLMDKLKIGETV